MGGENVYFQKVSSLLREMKSYTIYRKEVTIFDVGARGYYENPTTDLLAFFADTDEKHGLGSLVAEALLSPFDGERRVLNVKTEREIATNGGLRIDLLLVSDDWVLAVENKINHVLSNDLGAYEVYVDNMYPGKEKLYLVLSPEIKKTESPWLSLTYKKFIEKIEGSFDEKAHMDGISDCSKKWGIFFRDFVFHLRDIAVKEYKEDRARDEFVQKNFASLRRAFDLRNSFINDLFGRLRADIESKNGQVELSSRRVSWPGGLALRYRFAYWHKDSDVTIFLSEKMGEIELEPRIRVYAYTSTNKEICQKAEDIFGKNMRVRRYVEKGSWMELNDTLMVWEESLQRYNYEKIRDALLEKIQRLDDFEKNISEGRS